jgi:cobalt/nickel transport system permease protein
VGFLSAVAVVSWFSVVLASAVCAIELAISGTSPMAVVLPAMAGVHMLIGIGEAIITTTVMSLVLSARPDLVVTYDLSALSMGGTSNVSE